MAASSIYTSLMERIATNPNPDDIVMSPDEAAAYTSLPKGQLAQLRYAGQGPAFLKPAPKTVLYRKGDIDVWLSASVRHSTAEVPA
ncbi:DNA-binding protein [Bifidobacterium imperatoris]|uniref:DNA binding domain, excisionase family n=2 Tax=Bifidobacterium imperatoris TaxID=2020965 RepID=A0A2N5ITK8_9BIFI|nr:DNA-binding protein [Bifidobacterium imperatoris]PLS25284.1 DNA binding domain, excisionase family [Bifidobacterium imperatoris]QSY58162.1 DNA-binding protein [Bifidobacterium imperatoris]